MPNVLVHRVNAGFRTHRGIVRIVCLTNAAAGLRFAGDWLKTSVIFLYAIVGAIATFALEYAILLYLSYPGPVFTAVVSAVFVGLFSAYVAWRSRRL